MNLMTLINLWLDINCVPKPKLFHHLNTANSLVFRMSFITPMLRVITVARQTKLTLYELNKYLKTWIRVSKTDVLFNSSFFYQTSWCSVSTHTLQNYYIVIINLFIVLLTGNGGGNGKAWGCDLSYKYVEINAEYTTWDLYSLWRKMSSLVGNLEWWIFRCNQPTTIWRMYIVLQQPAISYQDVAHVLFFPARSI